MDRKIKPKEYIRCVVLFMFLIGAVNLMAFGFNVNGFVITLLSGICWRVNEKVGKYE